MRCMTKIIPLFYPGTLWCFRILSSSPASYGQGSEASHSFAARNPEISSISWQSSEWKTSRGYSKPPHFLILRLRIIVLTSISKTIYCVWNQQVTGPASCSWPPEVSTASLGRALSAASLASMAAIFEKASGSSTGASSTWWEWFEPLPYKGISWEYKCALFRFWNYIRSCIYMKHCFSQI